MPRAERRLAFRLTAGLLLVAAGLALGVLSGEALVRVLRPGLAPLPDERSSFSVYDPELGWAGNPGAQGRFRGRDFDVAVSINSRGQRDAERSYDKPRGVRRIVVLGDSFTWGLGVEQGQRFTELLERRLPHTQVLNFGCSGYGNDQELLLLRREGFKYHPDLVLVAVHAASDVHDNPSSLRYSYEKPLFVRRGRELVLTRVPVRKGTVGFRMRRWLYARSALFRLILGYSRGPERVDRALAVLDRLLGQTPSDSIDSAAPDVDLTARLLEQIQRESAAHGVGMLAAVIPDVRFPDQIKYHPYYDDLILALMQGHVPYLDLRDDFQAYARSHPGAPVVFAHDAHWNAQGHALAADALAAKLAQAARPARR